MKKLFCLFIFLFTICFIYEKRLALAEDADSPLPCLTILPEAEGEDVNRNINRAPKASVALRNRLWNHEDTVAQETNSTFILTVRFLGGTDDEKALVKQIAPEWSNHANIIFEFVENGSSDIRINFDPDGGNWSHVGKYAKQVKDHDPTMNLALSVSGRTHKKRVILHEFGHALGLTHEHKSPIAPFQWNEEVVIKQVSENWRWNEEDIKNHILNRLNEDQANFSEFDPDSIMVYPIPNEWTIGDFETNYNTCLSVMDKYGIRVLYGIVFSDLNLRSKIEDTLGLGPKAPITPDGLEQLTEFRATGNQIRDLTGLEDATQLMRLSLDGNEIVDVSPLSNLTQLTTLWLDGNEIVDVSPLSNLTQLTTLWLNDNSIEDITPLVGLVNLKELRLAENPIQDMSSLCQLLARNPALGVDIPSPNCDGESAKIYWFTFNHVTDTDSLKSADLDGRNQRVLHIGRDTSPHNLVVDSMSGKIYWIANNTVTKIVTLESADLDGRNQRELDVVRDTSLYNLVVDSMGGKIYWIANDNTGTDHIRCVDSDEGNPRTLHTVPDASLHSLVVDGMGGKIYWIANDNTGTDHIRCVDSDEGNPRTLHTVPDASLHSLVVDGMGGKIYWIANDKGTDTESLKSADLDGENQRELHTVQNISLHNLVVDGVSGKIYWIAYGKGTRIVTLESADLDGRNPQTLHIGEDNTSLYDLVVDGMGGKIYWIADNRVTEMARLESADLGGGNPRTLVSSTNWISTFAVATSPIDMPPRNADVNGDGIVNVQDLVLVASNFGKTGDNAADVNKDGMINILDLVLVAGAFSDAAAAPSLWSVNSGMTLTRTEVQQWLSEVEQLDITDPTTQRGIRFLQQLLAALTPKVTILLPNYPNPFNPETWIPYQLAESADVHISIYTADGKLVRTLALGQKPAGIYESRNRAAYWDGKNALGESVASGIYFYTLTAGDFTATRKMLIAK